MIFSPPRDPSLSWRGIVLYGLNTATYKIALATCLIDLAQADHTALSMTALAEAFFDQYEARLTNGKPKLDHPGRETILERFVQMRRLVRVDRDEAFAIVASYAFVDVVARFHTEAGASVPLRFYDVASHGLILTDHMHELARTNRDIVHHVNFVMGDTFSFCGGKLKSNPN